MLTPVVREIGCPGHFLNHEAALKASRQLAAHAVQQEVTPQADNVVDLAARRVVGQQVALELPEALNG